jgi:hypothetical protein
VGRLDFVKEYKDACKLSAVGINSKVLFKSRVYRAGGNQLLGTLEKIPYDTVEFETHISYNTGTYRWTIPAHITTSKRGHIVCNANFDQTTYFAVHKNGVLYRYGSATWTGGNREASMVPIEGIAGDYFEVFSESGTSKNINSFAQTNWAEIVLYADADIAGSGVLLRSIATRSGAPTVIGSGLAKFPYNVIEHESTATFDTVNNRWVVPAVSGVQRGYLIFNALYSGGVSAEAHVYKNGILYRKGNTHDLGRTAVSVIPIECITGDYFEVFSSYGGSISIDGNATFNWAELILFNTAVYSLISQVDRNFVSPVNIGAEPAVFPYNNVVYETMPTFNTGTSRWTIPAAITTSRKGYLFFSDKVIGTPTYIKVFKNGILLRHGGYSSSGSFPNSGVVPITAFAGDFFEVRSEHSGSPNADGDIDQNWAQLVLFGDDYEIRPVGNFLPATSWEVGIPPDAAKQIYTSQSAQVGNVVTVWGSLFTKFDNPNPWFDVTVPITNGNNLTAVSGFCRKQQSTEQINVTIATSVGARAVKVGFVGSGISGSFGDGQPSTHWDFRYSYTLA